MHVCLFISCTCMMRGGRDSLYQRKAAYVYFSYSLALFQGKHISLGNISSVTLSLVQMRCCPSAVVFCPVLSHAV